MKAGVFRTQRFSYHFFYSLHYEKFADGSVKCIEDEIPFDLPDGWTWTRLDAISEVITKGASPKWQGVDYTTSGTLFVTSENVGTETLLLDSPKYLSDRINEIQPRSILKKHDILTNIVGASIGRTCEYTLDTLANTNQAVAIIRLVDLRLGDFIIKCLNSEYCIDLMLENQVNVARANLSLSSLAGFLLPIPPLNEKQRIMEKVSMIFSYIDMVSKDVAILETTISKTKAKVLDLAIRGLLIPQDPTDEPASVLLERIRAEKEQLIKSGKIKRDKKESIIFRGDDNSYYRRSPDGEEEIVDDLPYAIPDSWEWTTIGELFAINPRNKIADDMDVSFIPMPLIDDGYSGYHRSETKQWKDVKSGFTHFQNGDIGLAKITPCFENRKSVIFRDLCNGFGAGTTELHVLRPQSEALLPEYALALLKSEMFINSGVQAFTGAVGQQRVGKDYVMNTYFPLPPYAEQRCIVDRISKLFALIATIETAL